MDFKLSSVTANSGNEKGHFDAMFKYVGNVFLLPGLHSIELDQLNNVITATEMYHLRHSSYHRMTKNVLVVYGTLNM